MRHNWTKAEWDIACELFAAGKTKEEIAEALGRTVDQVRGRFHYQGLSPARREALKMRTNERRRALGSRPSEARAKPYVPGATPLFEKAPADLFAERAKRQVLQPRDLSAAFFGDPLPGYSALDRKLLGIAEPIYTDHSSAQLNRNKPTLAGAQS